MTIILIIKIIIIIIIVIMRSLTLTISWEWISRVHKSERRCSIFVGLPNGFRANKKCVVISSHILLSNLKPYHIASLLRYYSADTDN